MLQMRNNVQLIGHLGQDVEMKQTQNGSTLAKVSIATNESYRNQDGELVQNTQWHNLVAWGKTAELMHSLLKKGKEVLIQGKLEYNSYQDKEGKNITRSSVVVRDFLLLGKKETQETKQTD